MILGIDASNIRGGGTVTHLVELLRTADPNAHGFSRVFIWGAQSILARMDDRPWLVKGRHPFLEKSLPYRVWWQWSRLPGAVRQAGCDVLLVPGGFHGDGFRPVVTMSQNLLPFEWQEARRYGWSWGGLRVLLLRWIQSRSFRKTDGLVFLTRYARDAVMRVIKSTSARTTIIPHGVDQRFRHSPREQLPIEQYSVDRPFRILYVSTIDIYKHQWHAAEAVAQLRALGLPVRLELVGPAYYLPALARLRKKLERIDPAGEATRYLGGIRYEELCSRYLAADLCLFASSCENMPNILLEGMASGLPIACSNRGPMPEILGDSGVYFDPEDSADIARALGKLIESPNLRAKLAEASFKRSQAYSWPRCANETFAFLAEVTRTYRSKANKDI